LRTVRLSVESLRGALLNPSREDLEQCLPALEEAVRCLVSIERKLRDQAAESAQHSLGPTTTGATGLRTGLEALKNELRIVSRLIANGAAFCENWAKFLGGAEAGYVSTGQPASLTAGGSVSFRG